MSRLQMVPLVLACPWALLPVGFFFLWRGVARMRAGAPGWSPFAAGLFQFLVGAAATWFGVVLS